MYLIEPIRNGKYIDDGAVNLAMQVYINNNIFLDEDILLPYYCQPKVEIGRFQNRRLKSIKTTSMRTTLKSYVVIQAVAQFTSMMVCQRMLYFRTRYIHLW